MRAGKRAQKNRASEQSAQCDHARAKRNRTTQTHARTHARTHKLSPFVPPTAPILFFLLQLCARACVRACVRVRACESYASSEEERRARAHPLSPPIPPSPCPCPCPCPSPLPRSLASANRSDPSPTRGDASMGASCARARVQADVFDSKEPTNWDRFDQPSTVRACVCAGGGVVGGGAGCLHLHAPQGAGHA